MNLLLDTNIIISHFKGFFDIQDNFSNDNLSISSLIWSEVVYGIKKNNSVNKINQFKSFLNIYDIKILNYDIKTAEKYIELRLKLERKGEMIDQPDLIIAATTIINKQTLVTQNLKHFQRLTKYGLKIYKN